jgi:glycosyltransferase involved in cell wall biosynthesis
MTSSLPSVAVVVTLHNGAPWIQDTLASVQGQTHQPVEIVVLDDHSTDDGPELAAAVPGVSVLPIWRPSVKGAGPGRQCGFEHTSAPFVAFLDQDDLWHPDHLRLLATALVDRPSCPAAVARFTLFDDGAPPSYDAPHLDTALLDPWDRFPLSSIITPSGVLVRRSALDTIGGWPTVGPITDFLTWFHLSVDRPFVENQCATCAYRVHDSSHSARNKSLRRATYLQYKVDILTPLLHQRKSRLPNQALSLQIRLDALQAGGVLAAAYDAGTPTRIPDAAPALERLATKEPAHFDQLASFLFQYFLGPSYYKGGPERQTAFLEILLASWPSSAPESKRRLEAMFIPTFSMWAFLAFLRHNPFQLYRWSLGLTAARWRLRRRLPALYQWPW